MAVGPLGAIGIGVVSALTSIGGDELLATVWSAEEEDDDGFATGSVVTGAVLSVLRKADGNLNLTMRDLGAGFGLDLLLLAAGAAVVAGFDDMMLRVL